MGSPEEQVAHADNTTQTRSPRRHPRTSGDTTFTKLRDRVPRVGYIPMHEGNRATPTGAEGTGARGRGRGRGAREPGGRRGRGPGGRTEGMWGRRHTMGSGTRHGTGRNAGRRMERPGGGGSSTTAGTQNPWIPPTCGPFRCDVAVAGVPIYTVSALARTWRRYYVAASGASGRTRGSELRVRCALGDLDGEPEAQQATAERDGADREPAPSEREPADHVGEPVHAEQHA